LNASVDHITASLGNCDQNSPFLLDNEGEYQGWRQRKLELRRQLNAAEVFTLDGSGLLSPAQVEAARLQVQAFNCVLYASQGLLDKPGMVALNRQFGLYSLDDNLGADADGVTALQAVDNGDERALYIPYTNRALNWHTDGYYNAPERRINAFTLYCLRQADRGGGNCLFDHEMMYLLIRDRSPQLLEALMSPDLMRIPANVQNNTVIRAEESGPVFSLRKECGGLNMRYTSRPHNIVWKADKRSERALNLIREILMEGSALMEIRLSAGQGIICNNLLHGRQAFHDASGDGRLIYRARYLEAIDFERRQSDPGAH